jgi:hypothetical protein
MSALNTASPSASMSTSEPTYDKEKIALIWVDNIGIIVAQIMLVVLLSIMLKSNKLPNYENFLNGVLISIGVSIGLSLLGLGLMFVGGKYLIVGAFLSRSPLFLASLVAMIMAIVKIKNAVKERKTIRIGGNVASEANSNNAVTP